MCFPLVAEEGNEFIDVGSSTSRAVEFHHNQIGSR